MMNIPTEEIFLYNLNIIIAQFTEVLTSGLTSLTLQSG